MALPWGGSELAESAPAELERLFATVIQYMEKRPRPSQPALRPFTEAKDENDIPAQSDSGGASFLGQVMICPYVACLPGLPLIVSG